MPLGMSQGPPEVWKYLLWWGIFLVGMSLAWYMSFHQKKFSCPNRLSGKATVLINALTG